jgi:transposase
VSLRHWLRQVEDQGGLPQGKTTQEIAEIRELKKQVAELRRANEILKSASAFFAAELDRPSRY